MNFIFFCECSDFENKKGSGNISPPSRFVHLPGVQNLSLRPPTEVKFFTPCHFWNFQKFLMSRKIQIDESVIFVSVICHRWCSDTNSRIIFFLCTFSNFLLWDFLMPWHRNNFLSIINQQIHFATAPLWIFWILWICHCC